MGIFKDIFKGLTDLQEGYTLKEGLNVIRHPNGTPKKKGYVENGWKDGSWEEFDENGNLLFTEKYTNGKRDGSWEEFDENGNLICLEIYNNGKFIEKTKEKYLLDSFIEGKHHGIVSEVFGDKEIPLEPLKTKEVDSTSVKIKSKLQGNTLVFKKGDLDKVWGNPDQEVEVETDQETKTGSNSTEDDGNILSGLTQKDIKDSIDRVTGKNSTTHEIEGMTTFMFDDKEGKENKEYKVVEPEFQIFKNEPGNNGKYSMKVIVEGRVVEEWFHDEIEVVKLRREGLRMFQKFEKEKFGLRTTRLWNQIQDYKKHGKYHMYENCDWYGSSFLLVESGEYKDDLKHGSWNTYGTKGEVIQTDEYEEGNLIDTQEY